MTVHMCIVTKVAETFVLVAVLCKQIEETPDVSAMGCRARSGLTYMSFEAGNRGQSSCRCTLDKRLDVIGVIIS